MNQVLESHVDLPTTMDDQIHYLLFLKNIYLKTRLEPPIHSPTHQKNVFYTIVKNA